MPLSWNEIKDHAPAFSREWADLPAVTRRQGGNL
jgi:hypothetical protein